MTKQIKNWLVILLVIGAIAAFFLIANFLGGGEKAESEKAIVICKPQNAPPEKQECLWTAHIHFMLRVYKGSQEIPVGFEQGDLQAMHTHAEKNKIHWHSLIPVDPRTKEVNDWSVLKVEKTSRDLKLPVDGTPKFIVNGKEVEPSYIWQDGDTIEIRYE